jgi:hypothetical protein
MISINEEVNLHVVSQRVFGGRSVPVLKYLFCETQFADRQGFT